MTKPPPIPAECAEFVASYAREWWEERNPAFDNFVPEDLPELNRNIAELRRDWRMRDIDLDK